jgi:threonylcarbamoyladenosine tRNA methylthiotransferase MtaB
MAVRFVTLGCKVNQYETQNMRERLAESGILEAAPGAKASLYVINTCTVTAKADKESLYQIHRAYHDNPAAQIVVTGCLAERDRALIRKQPGVGLVIGNRAKPQIARHLKKLIKGMAGPVGQSREKISYFSGHTRAFVKVQDGCNNFCAYCKVPLVRGRSRSRPIAQVVEEASSLVSQGLKEIVLTGICLGAYGRDLAKKIELVDLIERLERVPGLCRIRLSSIEASDVTPRLIRHLAFSQKLCHHLHIPIQSGDDTVLRQMRRRYTAEIYLELVKSIRQQVPDIGITTDVLVGFPGETEAQFEHTVSLVKKIMPLRTHIFPYSPRSGTKAFTLGSTLSKEEVRVRIDRLRRVSAVCAEKFVKRFLNKAVAVLVEGRCLDHPGVWEGYTGNYVKASIASRKELANNICVITPSACAGDILIGKA